VFFGRKIRPAKKHEIMENQIEAPPTMTAGSKASLRRTRAALDRSTA